MSTRLASGHRERWAALLAALLLAWAARAAETRSYRGNATDLKTGETLYSENHTEHYEGGKHVYSIVSYRDVAEKEVCRKVIVFRKSRSAPDFRIDDKRDGYMEGTVVTDGRYKLFTRATSAEADRIKTYKIASPVVIDGGFDYFIRDNWAKLVDQEETLKFSFVVANKLDYVQFSLAKVGTETVSGIRCVTFKLAVSSFLAGLFVDPIYVAYSVDRKRLMEFRGMSNINDGEGKSHKARITFTYPWTKKAAAAGAAKAG
jgi:hypothetical protein